jgi:hypothetical protein
MCFVPQRAVNTSVCEIARAYKLTMNSIEPIAFIVPRKVSSPLPSTQQQPPADMMNHPHQKVRLIPIRHSPTSALDRALHLSRRLQVLLGSSRHTQIRLARNGRSLSCHRRVVSFPSGPGPDPTRSLTAPAPQSAQSPASSLLMWIYAGRKSQGEHGVRPLRPKITVKPPVPYRKQVLSCPLRYGSQSD